MPVHPMHLVTAHSHQKALVTGWVSKPQHITTAQEALARAPSLA